MRFPFLPPHASKLLKRRFAMAKTLSASPLITVKEDYIDMDLSPKFGSPPFSRDFKFKNLERENITYPADELFYKGNLFPVQLPPRLDLVQRFLDESISNFSKDTPIEELKEKLMIRSTSKRHWPKGLKFFKQTHLGSKIKASRDYLKSLFTKTKTSIEEGNDQLGAKVISITQKSAIDREKFPEAETSHRKSFSGVIRKRLMGKSSQVSGLSMYPSSDLNRWLEEESSIQGAIAYCKKTQENSVSIRKSASDVSFPSFAVPRVSVGCENQEREQISRG